MRVFVFLLLLVVVDVFTDDQPIVSTAYGATCAQVNTLSGQLGGVEDCLYLNVYTRTIDANSRRPVMFWIHGGFFLWGSSDDTFYGPEYLMRKDVVLVTVNYRLGIFGFLNLDDDLATGNQGLKDQVLGLQWVRDNIVNFGGDPDKVTIFGQSAGGASVHHLTLSALAKGLFTKAIAQSGVSLNSWTFQANPKESAFQLCELLGHTGKDAKSAVEFLKTIDAQKLIKTHKQMLTKDDKIQVSLHFGPSVDSRAKRPFLPVHPEVAAAGGVQVPLMIGYNNAEGIILYKNVAGIYDRFNNEFDKLMHPDVANMMKNYGLTVEDLKRIYFPSGSVTKANLDQLIQLLGDVHFVEGVQRVTRIQMERATTTPTYFYRFTYDKEQSFIKTIARFFERIYFKNDTIAKGNLDVLIDLIGDLYFVEGVHKIMKTQVEKSSFPTYYYQFTYDKELSLVKVWLRTKMSGSCHGDDLVYLFRPNALAGKIKFAEKGSERYRISEQMIEMWVNFATTGTPTPKPSELIPFEWQPISNTTVFPFINICENLRMDAVANFEQKLKAN